MLTSKRVASSAAMAIGTIAMWPGRSAVAADEFVVYGNPPAITVTVKLDRELLRADIENYLRLVDRQLRTTLARDLKAAPLPDLRLAGEVVVDRG